MLQVEELNAGGNPDEKDMDRYLKAHDDLQTVLRVYDGVLDGNEPLPLSRGAAGAGSAGTGEATAAAEAAFAAARANGYGHGHGGAYSSDDDSVEDGGASGEGARAKTAAAAAVGASGGRSSPAKGNLLDLEENAPLETTMTGEGAGGMMVAYADGQFMASNTNSVGGVSGVGGLGFDSASSGGGGPQGSTTASNFASASDTGAVYGSNQFGSNNLGSNIGSNNFGSSNFSSGGGVGEGSSGFGEWQDLRLYYRLLCPLHLHGPGFCRPLYLPNKSCLFCSCDAVIAMTLAAKGRNIARENSGRKI